MTDTTKKERVWLEERLYAAADAGTDEWDNWFCVLRNATNPKYGGDPEWTGDDMNETEFKRLWGHLTTTC